MLILLAPSKTMDFNTKTPFRIAKQSPEFIREAEYIAARIRSLNEVAIAKLMKISPAIAVNVHGMYDSWRPEGKKPALWAYKGDVYKGIKADYLDLPSATWAQDHFVIMSGLYGIVRPFDMIAPYRLEMKARFHVGKAKDLYTFWDNKLSRAVAGCANGIVCVLSSDEYARPVTRHLPTNVRIITPVFYDKKPNGGVGIVPIYSKMMRGIMARWMIDNRTEKPDDLHNFTGQEYCYDPTRSTPDRPAFYRETPKPLVFL
jgi:cytoplasmic iron level regulating protein YaaA (DUF328/UPF0246 family)